MAEVRQVQPARNGYLKRVKDHPSSHDCTIQIMGRVGEGKSAFINTYCAAVYGRWTMVAREASLLSHVTNQLHHYFHQKQKAEAIEGAKSLSCIGQYAEYPLPSFRDFAGLDDRNGPEDKLLIAALLFNTLEPGTSRAAFARSWLLQLTQKLKIAEAVRRPMATDRVFIVWSATNSVPENFLRAFRDVRNMLNGSDDADESALLFGRVFVIITNVDKVGDERTAFLRKKKELKHILGLPEFNILEIENYNEGSDSSATVIDREERSNPSTDLKVISFMDKVMNPAGGPLTRAEPTWMLNCWMSVKIAHELFGKDARTIVMLFIMLPIATLAFISTWLHPIVTTALVVSGFFLRKVLKWDTEVSTSPRRRTFEVIERLISLAEIFRTSLYIKIALLGPFLTGWFIPMLHDYTAPTIITVVIVILWNPILRLARLVRNIATK